MAVVSGKSVHFRVNGAGLTSLARDIFLEDKPSKAWRLLAHGLRSDDGASDAVARDVLDGTSKLVGDESRGIRAVPDRKAAEARDGVAVEGASPVV